MKTTVNERKKKRRSPVRKSKSSSKVIQVFHSFIVGKNAKNEASTKNVLPRSIEMTAQRRNMNIPDIEEIDLPETSVPASGMTRMTPVPTSTSDGALEAIENVSCQNTNGTDLNMGDKLDFTGIGNTYERRKGNILLYRK